MTFDEAFGILLGHEGGYVNNPADLGGETRWGISKRSYPAEDIPNITQARAAEIYRRDFWGPAGCDAIPDALKLDMFDCAVSSSVPEAIKLLQRAAGETPDGILGPLTLQAIQSVPTMRLCARFNGARLALLTGLPTWPSFGRGWARRIADNLSRI